MISIESTWTSGSGHLKLLGAVALTDLNENNPTGTLQYRVVKRPVDATERCEQ